MQFPKEIQNLNELLNNLPGVGPKLSSRLAIYLAVNGKSLSVRLSQSLKDAVENIKTCELCANVTNNTLCSICEDAERDRSVILVVEDALDLINIESSGEYKGLYHVLNGLISPMNGIGPSDIRIQELLSRLSEKVEEVILALNPNIEGDATGLFIKQRVEDANLSTKITRLAKGIPSGGDIEFASNQTIVDSMRARVGI
jgi:recombination protein RecR